jgi:hypothetical protein
MQESPTPASGALLHSRWFFNDVLHPLALTPRSPLVDRASRLRAEPRLDRVPGTGLACDRVEGFRSRSRSVLRAHPD